MLSGVLTFAHEIVQYCYGMIRIMFVFALLICFFIFSELCLQCLTLLAGTDDKLFLKGAWPNHMTHISGMA